MSEDAHSDSNKPATPKRRFRQCEAMPGERWVVLYDGQCAMCSHSVQFIHHKDTLRQFFFAPLGGEYAARVMERFPELKGLDTVVLVTDRGGEPVTAAYRSSAILEISRCLGGVWWWLSLLWIVPKPLRDWVYKLIAHNRRRIMRNKGVACMVPTPAFRAQCLS